MSLSITLENVFHFLDSYNLFIALGLLWHKIFWVSVLEVMGFVNCASWTIADNFFNLVVVFDFDSSFNFFFETSLLDHLHGMIWFLEFLIPDLYKSFFAVFFVFSWWQWVEFKHVTEFFLEHLRIFLLIFLLIIYFA